MSVEENEFRYILSYFLDQDQVDRLVEYRSINYWRKFVETCLHRKISELFLEDKRREYGLIENPRRQALLLVKAIEYLKKHYLIYGVDPRIRMPPHTVKTYSNHNDDQTYEPPVIDLYLTTVDGQEIWVDALLDYDLVEEKFYNKRNYIGEYDRHYIVLYEPEIIGLEPLPLWDSETRILVYSPEKDKVSEYEFYTV